MADQPRPVLQVLTEEASVLGTRHMEGGVAAIPNTLHTHSQTSCHIHHHRLTHGAALQGGERAQSLGV